jgi:pimeloyl-ACP methyl ester carboxylesterase
MSTLVAVHGAWAGGYYWQDVADRVQRKGHATAVVEQLPSVGADPQKLGDLTADADHVRHVVDAVDGPVVLAGHSYGGMVITELADHPAVHHSLYVAGFWPEAGQSAVDMLGDQMPDWVQVHDDGTARLSDDPHEVIRGLGADVDEDRAMDVYRRSMPQSVSSIATPSAGRPHTHATTYVICEHDQAVPPAAQEAMAQRADHIVRLPTSHWAMFAAPDDLAAVFIRALDGQ